MGDARMSSGSEFQTVGASKAKLKPNCKRTTSVSTEFTILNKTDKYISKVTATTVRPF